MSKDGRGDLMFGKGEFVQRYEGLRQVACEDFGNLRERALFMRSGMMGWMQACFTSMVTPGEQPQSGCVVIEPQRLQGPLTKGSHAEMIAVAAQMVWAVYGS